MIVRRQLRSGDEIVVLPASRVGQDEMIGFLFRNNTDRRPPCVLGAPWSKVPVSDLLSQDLWYNALPKSKDSRKHPRIHYIFD